MPTHITADTIKRHISALQEIGTQLEGEGDNRWHEIAEAAALLESLRVGRSVIAGTATPPLRWIGLDMAKPGKDMTATFRRPSHA